MHNHTTWYRPEYRDAPNAQDQDPPWGPMLYPASKMYDTIKMAKGAITRWRGPPDINGNLPYWAMNKEFRIAAYVIEPAPTTFPISY